MSNVEQRISLYRTMFASQKLLWHPSESNSPSPWFSSTLICKTAIVDRREKWKKLFLVCTFSFVYRHHWTCYWTELHFKPRCDPRSNPHSSIENQIFYPSVHFQVHMSKEKNKVEQERSNKSINPSFQSSTYTDAKLYDWREKFSLPRPYPASNDMPFGSPSNSVPFTLTLSSISVLRKKGRQKQRLEKVSPDALLALHSLMG